MSYNDIDTVSKSEEWKSIVVCNEKALNAFKQLVQFCSSSSSSSNSNVDDDNSSSGHHQYSYHILVPTNRTHNMWRWRCKSAASVRLLHSILDVDPDNGVRFGEEIDVAVRRGIIGCKVGIVMLTPDYVGKKWPVFEWFMLEARHDVCSPPASATWRDLKWPTVAAGNASVWLDVIQRLLSLRPLSIRVAKRESDVPWSVWQSWQRGRKDCSSTCHQR